MGEHADEMPDQRYLGVDDGWLARIHLEAKDIAEIYT
jgi:hypothetical protein